MPAAPEIRMTTKVGAAEFFGVSANTIESWARRGCPGIEKGGSGKQWSIDLLEMARWKFSGEASAAAEPEKHQQNPANMTPSERKAWFDSETRRRELQRVDRELIPAAEVEAAVATAFASISQDWQGLQDLLERKHGVSPQIAATVQKIILASMDGIADKLAALQDPVRQREAA